MKDEKWLFIISWIGAAFGVGILLMNYFMGFVLPPGAIP